MGNPGRFTRVRSKILGVGNSALEVTKARVKAMAQTEGDAPFAITKMRAVSMNQRVYTNPVNGLEEGQYFTRVRAKVMRTRTPNFGWIDMFVDEVFPYDISFNSQASTVFATDVITADSGHTQRSSRWQHPMMSYNIAYGVRTMEHLHGLAMFFRAMMGQKHAFRYLDVMDFTSTFATRVEARGIPDISPTDQVQGIGDWDTTVFQLRKGYTAGPLTHWRPIYKPIPGSVTISLDDVVYPNVSVDFATGKITFLDRVVLQGGTYPGTVEVDVVNNGTRLRFIAAAGAFDAFEVGDRILTSNFVAAANNTNSVDRVFILAKAADASWIETDRPNNFGADETPNSNFIIKVHPAPPTDTVIKAGFKFHVPVRFNTDELPMSLEEYGIGSALNLRLMEVRPWEENL